LIGKDAWKKRGSSMFLNYGDVVSIDELIQGLLAVSGNDAAIALAETSAGGMNNFIALMNLKAKELGLKNSRFKNPHGLSEDGHYMSLRDLATLTSRLYQDFPEFSHYLSIHEFTYRAITQPSRNPLIKNNYDGIVGGKTGHTNEGGYGMVGVVQRGNRRLIAVVNKTKTAKQRAAIATEMFNYGFDKYKKLTLFQKNQPITKLQAWLGSKGQVDVVPDQEVAVNVPFDQKIESIRVKVKYKGPIYAPIHKGLKLATLVVEVQNYGRMEYSLFAKEDIDKAGALKRMNQILRYKIGGFLAHFGV
jgi:D-alanyl-D-alanine carboxypeptidase (penicillin-binding protein 5/6)